MASIRRCGRLPWSRWWPCSPAPRTPRRGWHGRLIAAGHGQEVKLSVACRLLLPDEQLFPDLTPAEVAEREFAEPNVLLVEHLQPLRARAFGREDREYLQRAPEKGLITKQEARVLSLAKLRLAADATVWDIGAGSGAVGLEAAALAPQGHVWAIEKNVADAANARANAVAFSGQQLHPGRRPGAAISRQTGPTRTPSSSEVPAANSPN
jgi:hypothetical protein